MKFIFSFLFAGVLIPSAVFSATSDPAQSPGYEAFASFDRKLNGVPVKSIEVWIKRKSPQAHFREEFFERRQELNADVGPHQLHETSIPVSAKIVEVTTSGKRVSFDMENAHFNLLTEDSRRHSQNFQNRHELYEFIAEYRGSAMSSSKETTRISIAEDQKFSEPEGNFRSRLMRITSGSDDSLLTGSSEAGLHLVVNPNFDFSSVHDFPVLGFNWAKLPHSLEGFASYDETQSSSYEIAREWFRDRISAEDRARLSDQMEQILFTLLLQVREELAIWNEEVEIPAKLTDAYTIFATPVDTMSGSVLKISAHLTGKIRAQIFRSIPPPSIMRIPSEIELRISSRGQFIDENGNPLFPKRLASVCYFNLVSIGAHPAPFEAPVKIPTDSY